MDTEGGGTPALRNQRKEILQDLNRRTGDVKLRRLVDASGAYIAALDQLQLAITSRILASDTGVSEDDSMDSLPIVSVDPFPFYERWKGLLRLVQSLHMDKPMTMTNTWMESYAEQIKALDRLADLCRDSEYTFSREQLETSRKLVQTHQSLNVRAIYVMLAHVREHYHDPGPAPKQDAPILRDGGVDSGSEKATPAAEHVPRIQVTIEAPSRETSPLHSPLRAEPLAATKVPIETFTTQASSSSMTRGKMTPPTKEPSPVWSTVVAQRQERKQQFQPTIPAVPIPDSEVAVDQYSIPSSPVEPKLPTPPPKDSPVETEAYVQYGRKNDRPVEDKVRDRFNNRLTWNPNKVTSREDQEAEKPATGMAVLKVDERRNLRDSVMKRISLAFRKKKTEPNGTESSSSPADALGGFSFEFESFRLPSDTGKEPESAAGWTTNPTKEKPIDDFGSLYEMFSKPLDEDSSGVSGTKAATNVTVLPEMKKGAKTQNDPAPSHWSETNFPPQPPQLDVRKESEEVKHRIPVNTKSDNLPNPVSKEHPISDGWGPLLSSWHDDPATSAASRKEDSAQIGISSTGTFAPVDMASVHRQENAKTHAKEEKADPVLKSRYKAVVIERSRPKGLGETPTTERIPEVETEETPKVTPKKSGTVGEAHPAVTHGKSSSSSTPKPKRYDYDFESRPKDEVSPAFSWKQNSSRKPSDPSTSGDWSIEDKQPGAFWEREKSPEMENSIGSPTSSMQNHAISNNAGRRRSGSQTATPTVHIVEKHTVMPSDETGTKSSKFGEAQTPKKQVAGSTSVWARSADSSVGFNFTSAVTSPPPPLPPKEDLPPPPPLTEDKMLRDRNVTPRSPKSPTTSKGATLPPALSNEILHRDEERAPISVALRAEEAFSALSHILQETQQRKPVVFSKETGTIQVSENLLVLSASDLSSGPTVPSPLPRAPKSPAIHRQPLELPSSLPVHSPPSPASLPPAITGKPVSKVGEPAVPPASIPSNSRLEKDDLQFDDSLPRCLATEVVFRAMNAYSLLPSATAEHPYLRIPLQKRVSIGRSNPNGEPNFVQFLTTQVISRNHLDLWEEKGVFYIMDNGSNSGTWLNGVRLSAVGKKSGPTVIQTGDVLRIGSDFKKDGEQEVDVRRKAILVRLYCRLPGQDTVPITEMQQKGAVEQDLTIHPPNLGFRAAKEVDAEMAPVREPSSSPPARDNVPTFRSIPGSTAPIPSPRIGSGDTKSIFYFRMETSNSGAILQLTMHAASNSESGIGPALLTANFQNWGDSRRKITIQDHRVPRIGYPGIGGHAFEQGSALDIVRELYDGTSQVKYRMVLLSGKGTDSPSSDGSREAGKGRAQLAVKIGELAQTSNILSGVSLCFEELRTYTTDTTLRIPNVIVNEEGGVVHFQGGESLAETARLGVYTPRKDVFPSISILGKFDLSHQAELEQATQLLLVLKRTNRVQTVVGKLVAVDTSKKKKLALPVGGNKHTVCFELDEQTIIREMAAIAEKNGGCECEDFSKFPNARWVYRKEWWTLAVLGALAVGYAQ